MVCPSFEADSFVLLQPHGVTASATVAGEDVSDVNAAVDPDCDGSLEGKSEGPCATVSGRK